MYRQFLRASFGAAAFFALLGRSTWAQDVVRGLPADPAVVQTQAVSASSTLMPAWTLQAPAPLPGVADPSTVPVPAVPGPVDGPVAPPCAVPDAKVPFKWSWGGQWRIDPNSSNFSFQPATLNNDPRTETFVQQRFRLWATVNPNDNIEGYIQVQIGGMNWGTNGDFSKTFVGSSLFLGPGVPPSALATDQVGIMLRRAWLAYQDADIGKFRVGYLDWHDSFGDTLASSDYDFEPGGIDWTKVFKEYNDLRVILGLFEMQDLAFVSNFENQAGARTALLVTADVDQPIDENTTVGASVYFLPDLGEYSYSTFGPYKAAYDTWVGVRGKTKLANALPVNAFAILNTGYRTDVAGATVFRHTGVAGKLEFGPLEVGPGKFSLQTLFSSGSDHPGIGNTSEFRTVAQSYMDNFGSQGYWSYLYLTSPNGPADTNDLGVSLQDRGLGLMTVQAKYNYPLTCKLTGETAAGWLESAAKNPTSNSNNIGTEIAEAFTYKFGGGLVLDAGAAYLFTGGFYKATPTSPTPSNLVEFFARLQLEF